MEQFADIRVDRVNIPVSYTHLGFAYWKKGA